jgi:hypothetical protein
VVVVAEATTVVAEEVPALVAVAETVLAVAEEEVPLTLVVFPEEQLILA